MALLPSLGVKKSVVTVAGCRGNGVIVLIGLTACFVVTLLRPVTRGWVSVPVSLRTQALEVRAVCTTMSD